MPPPGFEPGSKPLSDWGLDRRSTPGFLVKPSEIEDFRGPKNHQRFLRSFWLAQKDYERAL